MQGELSKFKLTALSIKTQRTSHQFAVSLNTCYLESIVLASSNRIYIAQACARNQNQKDRSIVCSE